MEDAPAKQRQTEVDHSETTTPFKKTSERNSQDQNTAEIATTVGTTDKHFVLHQHTTDHTFDSTQSERNETTLVAPQLRTIQTLAQFVPPNETTHYQRKTAFIQYSPKKEQPYINIKKHHITGTSIINQIRNFNTRKINKKPIRTASRTNKIDQYHTTSQLQQSFNKKSIKKQVQPQVITRTTHNYKDFIQTLHERNTPVTNSELYENVHGKRKNNHCKRTHGNKSGELLTNVHIRFTRDTGNLETQIKHCTPSTITNHCSLEISNNKLEDSRRNFNSTIIPTDRVTEGEIQHKPNTYPIYTIKPNTTRLDKLTPINKINQELILHKYIQSSKSTELDQFLNAPKQRKSSQIIQNQLQSLQVEQRPKQFNNYRTFVQHIKEDKSQYSTINISSEIKTKQHPALFNNRLINTSNIVYQTTNIQNNNHITYPKYNRKSHIFTLHNSNNTSKHKSHLTNKGLQSLHKASPHTQNQATINNSSRIRQL